MERASGRLPLGCARHQLWTRPGSRPDARRQLSFAVYRVAIVRLRHRSAVFGTARRWPVTNYGMLKAMRRSVLLVLIAACGSGDESLPDVKHPREAAYKPIDNTDYQVLYVVLNEVVRHRSEPADGMGMGRSKRDRPRYC